MSKPAAILVGTTALALLAVLGVHALRERRPATVPAVTVPSRPAPAPEPGPTPAAAPSLPPPAPAIASLKPRKARAPDAGKLLDEDALLAKINAVGPSDLELTLRLAREAVARFPGSPKAPEFEMNIAKSLLHLGRVEEARDQARHMLEKYPSSPFTLEVEHHLLRNPPNPK